MSNFTASQNTPADLWASWKALWQRAGGETVGFGGGAPDVRSWQEGWQRLTEANTRLLQGMTALSQHQVSLAQQLIAEDYGDLTRFRDGGALMPLPAQQIDLARRRFQRNLLAMRQVTDEMSQCFFDAAQTALGGWAAEVATDLPQSEPIRTPGTRAHVAKAAA